MKFFPKKINLFDLLQQKLEASMLGLFGQVIKDRGKYYSKNQDRIPEKNNIQEIINGYANQNAFISGGSGLVPGPMGLLAIVPEITLVIRNQLKMIYDIGVAYGYKNKLNPEILASIFAFAIGSGTLGLLVIHGQKVLVKRASLKTMQRVVHLMAGRISQRLLKSYVSKWIPVAGAVALAAWSKFSTHLIADKAISIFEKDLDISKDIIDIETVEDSEQEDISCDIDEELEVSKIQSLVNLILIDGVITNSERQHITTLINESDVSEDSKKRLSKQVEEHSKVKIDYSRIAAFPDDAVSLLVDLVGIAKRDGEFHISEKLYVKQVGRLLGFSEYEIEELIVS